MRDVWLNFESSLGPLQKLLNCWILLKFDEPVSYLISKKLGTQNSCTELDHDLGIRGCPPKCTPRSRSRAMSYSTLLRVIPTLTKSVLVFYLESGRTSYLASFPASILTVWHSIWHSIWHPFLTNVSGILSDIFSGVLSDISSEILCGRGPAGITLIQGLLFGS